MDSALGRIAEIAVKQNATGWLNLQMRTQYADVLVSAYINCNFIIKNLSRLLVLRKWKSIKR